jgi:RNA 3'-terminal phosphate cyclase (ATP)
MIEIDGSMGEGGGQVLRSALTLSIVSGKPFHMVNIRARRPKPGLMAQHLKAVDAAAAISKAQVEGAHLGSTTLTFEPQEIRSGRYHFEIGTAGSTSLVLQTIYLPLSLANSASTVTISGGTHVPWSPCYHFLDLHWLPYLRKMGFSLDLKLEQAGFYPQGGGRMVATIRPAGSISSLRLTSRGNLKRIYGISAVANLPLDIAERQKRRALQRLQPYSTDLKIKIQELPSKFKGTLLLLIAEFTPEGEDHPAQCCYYALGERGKPAERVADEAVDALLEFLATEAAIDQYLADQLLLPLAFAAGPSEISPSKITAHLVTNAQVIQAFGVADIHIAGEHGKPGRVLIAPTQRK